MSAERIQKILARAGLGSRRKAEELLREGRVTVNGQPAGLGDKADPAVDAIKVDGRRIRLPSGHRYLLLNKPRKVITSRSDPEGRQTVFDLLPSGWRRGVFAVGRLDYHSEGLLVLTDDGDFAQRLSHPSQGCSKTYLVKVKGIPGPEALEKLRGGIVIGGRKTRPAKVRPAGRTRAEGGNSRWQVEISEGRTRQIREMFHRVGHPVQRLSRVAIGRLSDPRLPPGAVRELAPEEVAVLAGRPAPRGGRRPKRPRRRPPAAGGKGAQ